MSDDIKHECGLAFIRLRKPFSYYLQKYGTVLYGLNKLYLLMEKQHNRGQDGAGMAAVKLNVEPGYPFLHRIRSVAQQPIADLFATIGKEVAELEKFQPTIKQHPGLLKGHLPFLGELLLGHLRYGTQGKNNADFCHPFIRREVIPARNLALAGNFNLVNTEELFKHINFEAGKVCKTIWKHQQLNRGRLIKIHYRDCKLKKKTIEWLQHFFSLLCSDLSFQQLPLSRFGKHKEVL